MRLRMKLSGALASKQLHKDPGMSPGLSLYLDVIRFLASLGVLGGHLVSEPFTTDAVWWPLGAYSTPSVTVFFVLSGYVIGYVTESRERTAGSYAISRISRLYSVVLIGLALTFLCDRIGMHYDPGLYRLPNVLMKPESWTGYLASLAFLNEYQVFHFGGIAPGTNGPFWSLSYEATYYAVAGLVLFVPRRLGVIAALVLLAAAGRTITALLPVWLFGFALYRWRARVAISPRTALLLLPLTALALLGSAHLRRRLPGLNFGLIFPWDRSQRNRDLTADYLVALIFAAHLAAAQNWFTHRAAPRRALERVGHWLGLLTFPLYCTHFPALCLFRSLSPWAINSTRNAVFLALSTLGLAVAITPACEGLKLWLRRRLRVR
jgi:peptidoglycan/LPS O-acetylase OafA/YrhL